jgi:hypothetical protein
VQNAIFVAQATACRTSSGACGVKGHLRKETGKAINVYRNLEPTLAENEHGRRLYDMHAMRTSDARKSVT